MSEKVYAWLLRLYPSRFQESYREDALQLFRDRARDEKGFPSGLRLWIDLLGDLAVSIPNSYRTVGAAVEPVYDGTPLFLTLEDELLNFSSLFYGVIASVAIYAVVLILASHAGASLPIQYSSGPQPVNYSEAAAGSSSAGAAGTPSYSGAIGKPVPRAGVSYASLPPTLGQSGAAGGARGAVKPLAFEVVSIHEDKSGVGLDDVSMGATPDGFRARNVPLLSLIQDAYQPSEGGLTFRLKQIIGLPSWAIFQIRYDVDARVSEADLPAWKDPALQPEMLHSMLQAMLADRFKLAVHREIKVVPIYDLTAGNRGPKLTPYNEATLDEIQQKHPGARTMAGGPVFAIGPHPGQQWFFGVTMSQLGTLLSNLAGRPVLDKTGLKGRYDVSYQIELLPPPSTDGVPPPPPSPDSDFFRSQISTIVEDQLGLKLKPATGPVESLVIDHVEQPSEN